MGELGSIPGLGRPLEKGKATHSVFWPGEFHGLYSPWGCKELDRTEQLSLSLKYGYVSIASFSKFSLSGFRTLKSTSISPIPPFPNI